MLKLGQNAPQENQNLESLLSESDWGEMVVLIFLGKFVISFALFFFLCRGQYSKEHKEKENRGVFPVRVSSPRGLSQMEGPEGCTRTEQPALDSSVTKKNPPHTAATCHPTFPRGWGVLPGWVSLLGQTKRKNKDRNTNNPHQALCKWVSRQ